MFDKQIEFIEIGKVSDMQCEEAVIKIKEKGTHWHDFYEIEIVVAGHGEQKINGVLYEEQVGDAFIMRTGDFHSFKWDDGEVVHLKIGVPQGVLSVALENLLNSIKGNIFVHLDKEKFEKIVSMYYMIEQMSRRVNTVEAMLKVHLVSSLILTIISNLKDAPVKATEKSDTQLISQITNYINSNIDKEISLSSLSKEFLISKEYLSKYFKETLGINVSQYIRKLRLNKATTLIRMTNMRIIDISEFVGFNSVTTFSRVFKNEFGISPSEMREGDRK